MRILGHRGAASLAPENTVVAIEHALSAGADGVECDLRLTADGALVLLHDERVNRTTDGDGPVADLTLAQVRRLDAGARFRREGAFPFRGRGLRVPTLAEAWDASGGKVVVEVKGSSWDPDGGAAARAVARSLADFLAARGHDRAVVSSFDPAVLDLVRAGVPGVRTGVLTTAAFDAAANVDAATQGGHPLCFLPDAVVDAAAIAHAHGTGRSVVVWTVDDPDRLRALAEMGADGVICDDPAEALRALRR
jgi:glycerophosphoryl diester phosphodiesterase